MKSFLGVVAFLAVSALASPFRQTTSVPNTPYLFEYFTEDDTGDISVTLRESGQPVNIEPDYYQQNVIGFKCEHGARCYGYTEENGRGNGYEITNLPNDRLPRELKRNMGSVVIVFPPTMLGQ